MSTDPYAPPQAEVQPVLSAAGEPRRPRLVWILSGFQAVGAFGGFLALMWTLSAANGSPTYYQPAGLAPRLSVLQILAELAAIGLWAGAAVSLFRLRAVAVSLVAISLALHLGMLGHNVWVAARSAGSSPDLGPLVLVALAGPVVKAGILLYAWSLKRRGVLR